MKIKNSVERYVTKMKKFNWELKCKNNENLIFEKCKSESKTGRKFAKDDLFRIITLFFLIPLFCFQAYKLYANFFIDTVCSKVMLTTFILLIIAIICLFIEIIENIYSYTKFKIDNSGEKSIYTIPIKRIKLKAHIATIEILSMITIVLVLSVITTGFNDYGYKTISNTDIPIKLTDLNKEVKGKSENSLTVSSSFLGKNISIEECIYNEKEENGAVTTDTQAYMNIEIFTSDYNWVLEKGFKSIYKQRSYFYNLEEFNHGEELKYWKAKKLYITDFTERILVYDNMIIDVCADIDFTKENIEIILKMCEEVKNYN